MTRAQLIAASMLRLLGAWLILRVLWGIGVMLWFHRIMGSPGTHTRWLGADPGAVDTNLHDTYYVLWPFGGFAGLAIRFVCGLVLLFATKPLARLLAWKLDDPG